MKIYRKETFGGILYDTITLSHKPVTAEPEKVARLVVAKSPPRRTDILSAPVRVYYEFTRRCNLFCSCCFANCGPHAEIGVPHKTAVALLQDLASSGVINIRFTGGEPTMREDWFDVLSKAKELGLVAALNTNGVFASPDDVIERIIRLKLEQVTISLDGARTRHDAVRGLGNFDKSMATLARLKKAGVNVRLTTILSRKNMDDIETLVELAAQFATTINFISMRPIGRAIGSQDIPDFEQHYASAVRVNELRKKYAGIFIFHSDLPLPEAYDSPRERKKQGILQPCGFMDSFMQISADGCFWPHHFLEHLDSRFKIGRFPEMSVLDAWYSPKMDGFREWLRALRARCADCSELNSRCSGPNFEMEVSADVHNPYCVKQSKRILPWDFIH
ncbi:MAG TPA: radical SAM protein [Elusimicrobiales bacterium]|nr:radical SAM protein [Elusimicrobiales bacterium]